MNKYDFQQRGDEVLSDLINFLSKLAIRTGFRGSDVVLYVDIQAEKRALT